MGLNIAGATITSGASKITITNSSATLSLLNNGTAYASGTPMFSAGSSTDPAWTYPGNTWITPSFPNAAYNVYTCYNTSTYVFTAPIAGVYFFTHNMYVSAPTVNTDYIHPVFLINGSYTGPSGVPEYRLRHYGHPASSYCDSSICEVFKLNAADTVQPYVYFSSANVAYYKYYGQFDGVFIG